MFYNLADDLREANPMNGKYPQKSKELSEKALTWRRSLPVVEEFN